MRARNAGGRHAVFARLGGALLVVALAVMVLLTLLARAPLRFYADARDAHGLRPGPPTGAYPYATAGSRLDPWGFTERQCTSYVAWYLNSHGVPFAEWTQGTTGRGRFRNAGGWDAGARKAGFTVSTLPWVGSVAQWHAGEQSPGVPPGGQALVAGVHGHVAIVVAVLPHGLVDTVSYDGSTRTFERLRTRAPRYIGIGTAAAVRPLPTPARSRG